MISRSQFTARRLTSLRKFNGISIIHENVMMKSPSSSSPMMLSTRSMMNLTTSSKEFSNNSYPTKRLLTIGAKTTTSAKTIGKTIHGVDVVGDFNFDNLAQLIHNAIKTFGKKKIFGTRTPTGYEWMTYEEFGKNLESTCSMLEHDANVTLNTKVAMISNNRHEWASVMYSTVSLGAQLVPMYEAQMEKDWKFIIEDSEASVLVVSTEEIYNRVKGYIGVVGNVKHIYCMDAPETEKHSLKYWMKKGQLGELKPASPKLDLSPDHVCTVIYTSGTTGEPKGVELTHDNIVSDVHGARLLAAGYVTNVTSLTFLPWAHVYGLTSELHTLISTGSALALVPHKDLIMECLQYAKPNLIFCVPILFNKVHDGIVKNMQSQSSLTKFLFSQAMATARARNELLEMGKPVSPFLEAKWKFLDNLVLSKVRAKLGGNLQYLTSGGSAASLDILRFFEDLGISILEGYGLTETSPMITASGVEWENRRLGCVGVPLGGVDVRIVDPKTLEELPADTNGEIVCSGPVVMKGYRNRPEANKEVFFELDGKRFFRTGDQGAMIDGRFLKITGRIKEQFKLENGKYVVPAPVEDKLSRGPFISQACIYGDNKPSTVALLVPNYVALKQYASENQHSTLGPLIPSDLFPKNLESAEATEALFNNEEFIRLVTEEIVHNLRSAKRYEKPSVWSPLAVPFSPENMMLTQKLSLRRKNVLSKFMPIVDDMYANKCGHRVEYPRSADVDA